MIGCRPEMADQLRRVTSSDLLQFSLLENARKHGFHRYVEEADLVVLHEDGADGSLPRVCELVRHITDVPIIALVEAYDEETMAQTFEAGANDYVYPNYSSRELLARIRAQLRRVHEYVSPAANTERYELNDLTIDIARHEVTVRGQLVKLTPKEFDLLRILAAHCEKALSRQDLLKEVWGLSNGSNTRTLDVHIGRLRQKIEDNPATPHIIITVPSYGYKLKA